MSAFHIAVLTTLLAVTFTFGLDPYAHPTGSGLCVTQEWMGGQAMMTGAIVNGRKTVTNTMTFVSYSAKQRKIRAQQFKPNSILTLFDFPAGIQYTVTYPQSSAKPVCKTTPLPGPFKEQCIPDNYTVTVDPHTSFGAGTYVTYGWEARGTLGDFTYHVTMSNNMLPMFEEIYGTKDGVPFFQNLYFFNATATTFPPTAFSVPDACKTQ
ncbi:hypothetical protein BaRGS_00034990 [Batillaria attramentaria]|uniref:Uncharacterized protein n=1 Tax=Batillaria attramentaria TaxID=370345 RepID=A0ABD0JFS7_9CAEN